MAFNHHQAIHHLSICYPTETPDTYAGRGCHWLLRQISARSLCAPLISALPSIILSQETSSVSNIGIEASELRARSSLLQVLSGTAQGSQNTSTLSCGWLTGRMRERPSEVWSTIGGFRALYTVKIRLSVALRTGSCLPSLPAHLRLPMENCKAQPQGHKSGLRGFPTRALQQIIKTDHDQSSLGALGLINTRCPRQSLRPVLTTHENSLCALAWPSMFILSVV